MNAFDQRSRMPRRSFLRTIGVLHRGNYFLAQGSEIGESEIGLILPHEIKVGQRIVINFQIPGGSFISIKAQVKSVARQLNKNPGAKPGFNHVCEFIDMKFDSKREVRTFVSSRTEQEVYQSH